jgi:hypothetical protein
MIDYDTWKLQAPDPGEVERAPKLPPLYGSDCCKCKLDHAYSDTAICPICHEDCYVIDLNEDDE